MRYKRERGEEERQVERERERDSDSDLDRDLERDRREKDVINILHLYLTFRYKMLDKKLWPTNSLTPEQATKKLVLTYDLSEVVVFRKTQIFFKTQRTIFRLEAERQKKLPYIVSLRVSQYF